MGPQRFRRRIALFAIKLGTLMLLAAPPIGAPPAWAQPDRTRDEQRLQAERLRENAARSEDLKDQAAARASARRLERFARPERRDRATRQLERINRRLRSAQSPSFSATLSARQQRRAALNAERSRLIKRPFPRPGSLRRPSIIPGQRR